MGNTDTQKLDENGLAIETYRMSLIDSHSEDTVLKVAYAVTELKERQRDF